MVGHTKRITTLPVSVNRHTHRWHQLLNDNTPCCFGTQLLVCTGLGTLRRQDVLITAYQSSPGARQTRAAPELGFPH